MTVLLQTNVNLQLASKDKMDNTNAKSHKDLVMMVLNVPLISVMESLDNVLIHLQRLLNANINVLLILIVLHGEFLNN